MSDIESELRKIAVEVAARQGAEAQDAENEYLRLKRQLAAKEEALNFFRAASQRLSSFKPIIGGRYQCPICWGDFGEHANLVQDEGTGSADRFHCQKRHSHEFEFGA